MLRVELLFVNSIEFTILKSSCNNVIVNEIYAGRIYGTTFNYRRTFENPRDKYVQFCALLLVTSHEIIQSCKLLQVECTLVYMVIEGYVTDTHRATRFLTCASLSRCAITQHTAITLELL